MLNQNYGILKDPYPTVVSLNIKKMVKHQKLLQIKPLNTFPLNYAQLLIEMNQDLKLNHLDYQLYIMMLRTIVLLVLKVYIMKIIQKVENL